MITQWVVVTLEYRDGMCSLRSVYGPYADVAAAVRFREYLTELHSENRAPMLSLVHGLHPPAEC
jgi:hypothetical protein